MPYLAIGVQLPLPSPHTEERSMSFTSWAHAVVCTTLSPLSPFT